MIWMDIRYKAAMIRSKIAGFIERIKKEYQEGGPINVLEEKLKKTYLKILFLLLLVALKVASLYNYLKRSKL